MKPKTDLNVDGPKSQMADTLSPFKSSNRDSRQKIEFDFNASGHLSLFKEETNRTIERITKVEPMYQQLEMLNTRLSVAKMKVGELAGKKVICLIGPRDSGKSALASALTSQSGSLSFSDAYKSFNGS